MLENHSACRGLPDSVLYTFITGNVFGLGFKDAASAVMWSDTSCQKLWGPPDKPRGNEPLAHERCMILFCDRSRLWTALGKELPVDSYSTRGRKQITKPGKSTGEKIKQSWKDIKGHLSKATDGMETDSSD